MRVHVYHETAAERIGATVRAAMPGRDVVTLDSEDALARALPEVEVLLCGFPPRDGWGRDGWEPAERLRLVQLMGAGADVLLPAPSLPAAVRVAGLRGVFAAEVAEHATLLMLALARGLPALVARQGQRRWRPFPAPSLAGASVCVVGLGAIGGRVARAAVALDMTVRGVRRSGSAHPSVAEVFGPERLTEALTGASYAVVTLPLTVETRAMIGAEALAALGPTGRLVQVGRGGVVDESALLEALESGGIGGAALDVFVTEPLPPASPLWDAPNLLLTPHVAGLGLRYVERAVEVLADNLARLERGEALRGRIDRGLGY